MAETGATQKDLRRKLHRRQGQIGGLERSRKRKTVDEGNTGAGGEERHEMWCGQHRVDRCCCQLYALLKWN